MVIDVKEFKEYMDRANYTEEERKFLRKNVSNIQQKSFTRLLNKAIRLGDTEYMMKLLQYSN